MKGLIQVAGIKYWHCTKCHREVEAKSRCPICGKTQRAKK